MDNNITNITNNETQNITNNETHSFEMPDIVQSIFNATKCYLDILKDGERMSQQDLIDKVVADTKEQRTIVSGIVSVYVKNYYPDVRITRGPNGGIIKGPIKHRVDNRKRCDRCNQVISQQIWDRLSDEQRNQIQTAKAITTHMIE